MPTKEQSVTQLRRNKIALATAMNHIGFDNVTSETRVSLFPQLIKWAHGLLDVTIACRRKSDGRHFYFTIEEWQSLSADEQCSMLMRGVRLRAEGRSLIVSLFSISETQLWGGRKAVTYQTNFDVNANDNLHSAFFDSYDECLLISQALAGQNVDSIDGTPAIDLALSYSAFTADIDGLDDETKWSLPSMAALKLLYRYTNAVNAVLAAVGAEQIRRAEHWTICSYNANDAYYLNMGNGRYASATKNTNRKNVRPIAVE